MVIVVVVVVVLVLLVVFAIVYVIMYVSWSWSWLYLLCACVRAWSCMVVVVLVVFVDCGRSRSYTVVAHILLNTVDQQCFAWFRQCKQSQLLSDAFPRVNSMDLKWCCSQPQMHAGQHICCPV